jgi:hypothetical protein
MGFNSWLKGLIMGRLVKSEIKNYSLGGNPWYPFN